MARGGMYRNPSADRAPIVNAKWAAWRQPCYVVVQFGGRTWTVPPTKARASTGEETEA